MKRDHVIVDSLEHASRYYNLHTDFEQAFAFLYRSDLAELADGRYEIDGTKVYCIISYGPGRTREKARLEAHQKYIDIQYVISGIDDMGWIPVAECKQPDGEYNAEKDIIFYKDVPRIWATVMPGNFAIFFPEDGHAPLGGTGELHKAIVKVSVY
ncbi:YhcH/YjgK/YiaL family protein [candidate division KSB1 bacterium]|nr:YhcH/YjgK/YiaL family protein [candidate division KSB1 bacterium]